MHRDAYAQVWLKACISLALVQPKVVLRLRLSEEGWTGSNAASEANKGQTKDRDDCIKVICNARIRTLDSGNNEDGRRGEERREVDEEQEAGRTPVRQDS